MPISEKRLAANQANAKKSTGPTSSIGRRNSSRNGTRHGILANALLVDHESRERFSQLINAFNAEFQPATFSERLQVEKMAASHWRLMRTWAVESAGIVHETRCQSESNVNENAPTRTMLAIRSLGDMGRHPDQNGRYEYRCDRQYYRALECLTRLKQARRQLEVAGKTTIVPREPMLYTENKGPAETAEPTKTTLEPTTDTLEPTEVCLEPTQ